VSERATGRSSSLAVISAETPRMMKAISLSPIAGPSRVRWRGAIRESLTPLPHKVMALKGGPEALRQGGI